MANNMYAKPAELDATPMDFSVYMQAQRVGAEAMQNKLQLEAQLLQDDTERARMGSEAVLGVTTALDNIRAYGKEDEEQLGEIRASYTKRLQDIVKQGVEGGGLHTIANPLRLESARLNTEMARGELGNIGKRHAISQENLKNVNELYVSGNLTNYDQYFYGHNLLATPKKSNNIVKEVSNFATASGLKNSKLKVLQAEYLQLARAQFPEDFQKMFLYDSETGADSMNSMKHSIMAAAAVQHADGDGMGNARTMVGGLNNEGAYNKTTPASPTGAGEVSSDNWFDPFNWFTTSATVSQKINDDVTLSGSLKRDEQSDQYEVQQAADKRLSTALFNYAKIDDKRAASVTKDLWAGISSSSVKSVTNPNTLDSGKLIADLHNEDKYEKGSFRVIGMYAPDNPYNPSGYAVTAWNIDDDAQEHFIVSNPTNDYYDNMVFQASRSLYSNELRAAGFQDEFNINVTDAGLESTAALYGTGEYTQGDANVSGAIELTDPSKSNTNTKYKLYTQAMMVDVGGGQPEWQIVADIINTETGERVDISGDKGYSTLNETIYWLRDIYNENFSQ